LGEKEEDTQTLTAGAAARLTLVSGNNHGGKKALQFGFVNY